MKNFCIAFDWNIYGQHYLQHNKEYLCTSLPHSTTSPNVCCASTVCITLRSVTIKPVKVPVVLEKRNSTILLVMMIPEGLIPLYVSHRVNHKHPKNLFIPVFESRMKKSMH